MCVPPLLHIMCIPPLLYLDLGIEIYTAKLSAYGGGGELFHSSIFS